MGTHSNSRTVSLNNTVASNRKSYLASGLLTGALVALMSLGMPSTASAGSCNTDINCGRSGTGTSGCVGGDCGQIYLPSGTPQIYYPLVASGGSSSSARTSTSQAPSSPFRLFLEPLNMLFGRK